MASIEPFIHRKIVVLHEDATARQAAHAMCEQAIGCVVVSNHQGQLTGIITDRDLTCAVIADSANSNCQIGTLMTSPLISIEENAELEQAIYLMETKGIRRIPVIHYRSDGTQRCCGIITLDDLIGSRSIDEFALIRIIKSQMLRRFRQFQQHTSKIRLAEYPEVRVLEEIPSTDFYQEIATYAGFQKYNWSHEQGEAVIKLIFEALIRRLHHTAAMHLVAQLPLSLQKELLEIPPGPDRTITASYVLREFQSRFGLDADQACKALTGVCQSLDHLLDQRAFAHVKVQLPEDFQALFRIPKDQVA